MNRMVESMSQQGARSLAKQVMEHVRVAVSTGNMREDEWYSVYQVADRLGFSRSPVREGLLRLEEAGLIRFAKNRGFQIVPTTPEDVAEIFAIRVALEVPATRRAAKASVPELMGLNAIWLDMGHAVDDADEDSFYRLDCRLHGFILGIGGTHRTREIVDRLRTTTRLLGATTAGTRRTLADIRDEHEPILDAIVSRDVELAAAAMKAHLETTAQLLIDQALVRSGRSGDGQQLWKKLSANYLG